ncbi:MAG: DMT family transporter [Paracoccaceae bacterium]
MFIVYSLSAALLFALSAHVQRLGLKGTDPATGALFSVMASAGLLWLIAPFVIDWSWFSHPTLWLFAAIGVLFPAAGQRLQILAVQSVGPSLTTSLASLTPLFAVSAGVIWLGEALNLQAAIGIGFTIAGLFLASYVPGKAGRGWPLVALLFPLGAALVRGIAQPLLKLGFETLPSPFFAILVGSTVSVMVLGVLSLWQLRQGTVKVGPSGRFFAMSGVLNGLGILSVNLALFSGSITSVSPLVATTPIWVILLAVFVFREARPTPRHMLVALMVVIGCGLILTR